ncbi:hypothetical protein [Puniceicoccus vermicola]|uniref:Uncharacterized protein n=1 Tax=Puniceicoccus vermicola TaxID=388746 RepID=A0A7X1AUI6_9BACT|nr:hypothetical protein [Puniceicoccus vermicola]MBC2600177.1 hypothetical protein [Puniceicoccus vermicola]
MDASLETVKWRLPEGTTEKDWDDAYRRLDAYLSALRIDNSLQRSGLIHRILQRAVDRTIESPQEGVAASALLECETHVCQWFREVLNLPDSTPPEQILERGYLSLLLFGAGSGWRQHFLQPGPWPKQIIEELQTHYIEAGPEFRRSHMGERPIDYGPWSNLADQTLRGLDKRPLLRSAFVAIFGISLVAILYYFSR